MDEPNAGAEPLETLARGRQRSRVTVEADEGAVGRRRLEDPLRVPPATDGASDVAPARLGGEKLKDFLCKDALMRVGDGHGASTRFRPKFAAGQVLDAFFGVISKRYYG